MIDPFKYVEPAPEKLPVLKEVADSIAAAYHVIEDLIPESRERSLAITKLQEARMWANAAISFHEVKNVG